MPLRPSLLPYVLSCLIAAFVLSSCSHSGGSGGGNPVNNSYLASVKNIGQGETLTDSFKYDDSKRVATYAQYATNGTDSVHIMYNFHFSSNSTLPDSYTYNYNDGVDDPHTLSFDGQGRVIKDTSLSDSHFVTYYAYSGNYVICRIFFAGDLNSDAFADTLVVTDGNMTGQKVWGWDHGVGEWEDQGQVTYGHAAAANPAYKAEIANSVGPLLYVLSVYSLGGWADYISKGIINKVGSRADGLPPGGVTYSVSTDGTGRVSAITPTGVGVPSGVRTEFTYY